MAGTMQGDVLGTTEMESYYRGLSSRLILQNQREASCVRAQGSLLLAKDREQQMVLAGLQLFAQDIF